MSRSKSGSISEQFFWHGRDGIVHETLPRRHMILAAICPAAKVFRFQGVEGASDLVARRQPTDDSGFRVANAASTTPRRGFAAQSGKHLLALTRKPQSRAIPDIIQRRRFHRRPRPFADQRLTILRADSIVNVRELEIRRQG